MTTLKSFELKGNKLSFANWISNLSPCDTPFTSMIGKEAIDQTQYSWQTDTLAPASNAIFEEGSQAVSQPRAITEVLTNFTSILRTVANVSDTVKSMSTYGRNKEMQYQLGKAGKEILRDLEYMTLHQVNGNPGSKNRASSFAGFEGLVGGLGVAEKDTGAVIHKEAIIAGNSVDKNDIFDITYNLYLTGSKADKIMFHPKYAVAFSAFITDDANADNTYRMFDNLDTKFNTQVKTIRDPLGRVYTLIPNRFMPEDKIYFFTEKDWTQTVLRTPVTTKIGKKGSSDQFMIEMEVGLRHRHPYASGILALTSKVAHNTMNVNRKLYTSLIGDSLPITCDTSLDGVGEFGHDVTFHTSDPSVIKFDDDLVVTDSNGRTTNYLVAGNKAGVADVWSVFKGVRSVVTTVTVLNPTIELEVNNDKPTAPEVVTFTAIVKKVDGSLAGNDLTLKWYVEDTVAIELTSISSTTTAGIATVTGKILNSDENFVQATFNGVISNKAFLNYTPKPASIIDFRVLPNTIDVGGFSNLTATVLDEYDTIMKGVTVNWASNDVSVGKTNLPSSVTDEHGVAIAALEGISRGSNYVTATVGNIVSSSYQFYVGYNASLDFEINPNPANNGDEIRFHGSIKGQDGLGIQDVAFAVVWDAGSDPKRLDITTDDEGEFNETHTFDSNSDQDITVEIPSLGINKKFILTFKS